VPADDFQEGSNELFFEQGRMGTHCSNRGLARGIGLPRGGPGPQRVVYAAGQTSKDPNEFERDRPPRN
jgi:hypothetical protein